MPRDKRWLVVALLAVACLASWTHALVSKPDTLELTYLDVGDGLCGVMRTPSGKIIVMDCGTSSWSNNDIVGEKLVTPYLNRLGANRIDLAVLSHPHLDHVSGCAGLVESCPPRMVIDIGAAHPSPQYVRFLRAVKKCGAKYRIARRGQAINTGDGVRIDILNPGQLTRYSDLNQKSIVMRVTFKKTSMLICSDAGEEAEKEILRSGVPVRAHVMQVGHHGSSSATSPEWLAAVRPSVAVISCGRRSQYGHPSRQTVARLAAAGARTYRTDLHGAVTIITDGRTLRVSTIRQNQ